MRDYKKDYEEFWKDIVENKDGSLNKDAVMRELSDYSMLLDFVPKVYMEVTGGRVSKTNTTPDAVIGAFIDHLQEVVEFEKECWEEEKEYG